MKVKYGTKATLLFTDTDSLCYQIYTEDLYHDIGQSKELFDTSNYDKDHELYSEANAKVIGKMKDELAKALWKCFVGLRPKMYSLMTCDGVQKNTAKGVSRAVIRQVLKHELYERMLHESMAMMASGRRIGSRNHQLYTLKILKVALSAYDDKRYVLEDGTTTLAHGHYRIGLPAYGW